MERLKALYKGYSPEQREAVLETMRMLRHVTGSNMCNLSSTLELVTKKVDQSTVISKSGKDLGWLMDHAKSGYKQLNEAIDACSNGEA